MKKLLNMLTIGILTSTSLINTNMFLNSSFDQKNKLLKNNKKPVFVDLKENTVGNYLYFNQDKMVFIDNQKNTYFVDNLGNFKSLNKKSDDAGSENFVPLNQNVGVFKSENGNSNLLDSNGKFINLDKIGDFFNWNDEKGLYIDEYQNMFFLTKTGQFISITKPEADMIPEDIQKFNNNLFFIWDSISKKSYLLSQEGIFQEIKKDGQSIQINSFCSFNDNLAFVETTKTGVAPDYIDINQSWFMNSDGDFIKEIKKEDSYIIGGDKYNWNDENIIYIEQDTSDVYLLSSNGSFKSLKKKALRFEKWTNTLGFFELNSGECWLTDISDVLKPENYILDKKVFSFSKFSENLAVFSDKNHKNWFLYAPFSEDDFSKFENSIHFDRTVENQNINEINLPSYKGKASNNDINFHAENIHITKVTLNGSKLPLINGKVNGIIEKAKENTIVVQSDFPKQLQPFKIYIKKQPTINEIKNVVGHQLTNYVGVFDNKNLNINKTPNLQDILVSDSEVEINYDNFLVDKNELFKVDKNNDKTFIKKLSNNEHYSINGTFFLQITDLVNNISNKYLTIGTPTITDFRTTDQWKQAENWALKNGYRQSYLDKMNANEIKDLLSKYNPSPTPSPTPNPNNNIGWYIFLGVFLGLITFGIAGFYINKFVIKPIRNKRSDIKSDKYVAEQMELSKKWKEQETKEKQARDKKKGGK